MEPSPEDLALASPVRPDIAPAGKTDLKSKVTYLPDIHRLLPQSPEAEQGVISSFLLAPNEVGSMCTEKQIKPAHFHIPAHAEVYGVLIELWGKGTPIDFITIAEHLRDRNKLDAVGGAPFVSSLFTFLPTAANAAYYLEILQEKFVLREVIRVCTEYAARSYDEQDEVPTILEGVEREVMAIRKVRSRKGCTARDMMSLGINELQRKIELRGKISGLSTGFVDLDKKTDGLHGAEFIVIASVPSLGKSALAMQIAENLAVDQNVPIAVFPLEMGRKQMAQRMITSRARVNTVPWRYGREPSQGEQERIISAAKEIMHAPMYFEDASDCTIQDIRAVTRNLVATHGVKVVIIDSMSALHSNTKQARDNRTREVAECSEGCKEMAKELDVTVILIAHVDKDLLRNQRPGMQHLRESGKIAMDADSIWFLWEPDWDESSPSSKPKLELWIPKQRDGEPFVTAPLLFEKQFTRFTEPEPEETAEQQGLGI